MCVCFCVFHCVKVGVCLLFVVCCSMWCDIFFSSFSSLLLMCVLLKCYWQCTLFSWIHAPCSLFFFFLPFFFPVPLDWLNPQPYDFFPSPIPPPNFLLQENTTTLFLHLPLSILCPFLSPMPCSGSFFFLFVQTGLGDISVGRTIVFYQNKTISFGPLVALIYIQTHRQTHNHTNTHRERSRIL